MRLLSLSVCANMCLCVYPIQVKVVRVSGSGLKVAQPNDQFKSFRNRFGNGKSYKKYINLIFDEYAYIHMPALVCYICRRVCVCVSYVDL